MDKTRVGESRHTVSKRGQGENLRNLDVREFVTFSQDKSQARLIAAEKLKALSVAYFFGDWNFTDSGKINIKPDKDWIMTTDMLLSENISGSRSNKPHQKHEPRYCKDCRKHWVWYSSMDSSRSRRVTQEYLRQSIFGNIPAVKEICGNCEDV
tara:strand:- start:1217 stop:1675 length:459 start_codon:yes stop_codon:yes gene_type:complete